MSPRRPRPREPLKRPRKSAFVPEIVTAAPPGWHARTISASRATKRYRCPGCEQEIKPGTSHVVAWRNGAESERRHWHKPCWELFRRTGR
jgi:hypothetical protein